MKFLGACFTQAGQVYLVTEYLENGSLRDILDKTKEQIDWKLKIRLLHDTSKGLNYLHSHNPAIIHRDLKPSNMLIDKKWRCKIADFGISKLKSATQYKTQTLVGTPAYLAPEVIQNNLITEKADVYR